MRTEPMVPVPPLVSIWAGQDRPDCQRASGSDLRG